MIDEVFRRIGTTSRRFIEFGVEDGLECNSTFLLMQGWRGAWIEGWAQGAARALERFASYPVQIVGRYVTVENADTLIAELANGEELDLLSIDIDSNDYWVWQAITTVSSACRDRIQRHLAAPYTQDRHPRSQHAVGWHQLFRRSLAA